MENYDIGRFLIDHGNSFDIMYTNLLENMCLTNKNCIPCKGSDLQRLNALTTRPCGYIELMVSFGKKGARKIVKTQFLIIDLNFIYNCRSLHLVHFGVVVSSIIHLELKYHSEEDIMATYDAQVRVRVWVRDTSFYKKARVRVR